MSVETITREKFEAVLPRHRKTNAQLWYGLGLKNGEYTYRLKLDSSKLEIEIRSSIDVTERSRGEGSDSIRAWIVDPQTGDPVGSKLKSYVTRTPGWDRRLLALLRDLSKNMLAVQPCPTCGKPLGVLVVKKAGPNKGRRFTSCCNKFSWLT